MQTKTHVPDDDDDGDGDGGGDYIYVNNSYSRLFFGDTKRFVMRCIIDLWPRMYDCDYIVG